MQDDSLYQKMHDAFLVGQQPITVRDAVGRWDCSEGHTRRVMDWMADQQQPPLLRKLPGISPYQWERI